MARTIGGATAWDYIVKIAFPGNQRIKGGKPRVVVSNAVPDFAAKVGTLCLYTKGQGGPTSTYNDAYICTVATGTWVKINA